jgi:hypothetical protein
MTARGLDLSFLALGVLILVASFLVPAGCDAPDTKTKIVLAPPVYEPRPAVVSKDGPVAGPLAEGEGGRAFSLWWYGGGAAAALAAVLAAIFGKGKEPSS